MRLFAIVLFSLILASCSGEHEDSEASSAGSAGSKHLEGQVHRETPVDTTPSTVRAFTLFGFALQNYIQCERDRLWELVEGRITRASIPLHDQHERNIFQNNLREKLDRSIRQEADRLAIAFSNQSEKYAELESELNPEGNLVLSKEVSERLASAFAEIVGIRRVDVSFDFDFGSFWSRNDSERSPQMAPEDAALFENLLERLVAYDVRSTSAAVLEDLLSEEEIPHGKRLSEAQFMKEVDRILVPMAWKHFEKRAEYLIRFHDNLAEYKAFDKRLDSAQGPMSQRSREEALVRRFAVIVGAEFGDY